MKCLMFIVQNVQKNSVCGKGILVSRMWEAHNIFPLSAVSDEWFLQKLFYLNKK